MRQMSNGSYDRRAPSAASQIITLERLLEESEERNAELEATIAEQRDLIDNQEQGLISLEATIAALLKEE